MSFSPWWKCAWLLACMALVGCSGYDSFDYLDGKFIQKDLTPANLLSPSDKSASTSRNPKFTWSRRNGASKYLLELSAKPDFSALLLSKSITEPTYLLTDEDLIGVTSLETSSYYWRITTVYPDQNITSSYFIFHILNDKIIYVANRSASGDQIGNKSSPFKTVQAAIEYAEASRNGDPTITKNIFVGAGTYSESITLKAGISIYGGYDTTWMRNPSANTTTLNAPANIAIIGLSDITNTRTDTTIVDGFVINGGSISNDVNYGIKLLSASPTISNNTISGGSGITSYGIYSSASSTRISLNTINGGTATTAYGIYNLSGSPLITGNNINGGGSASYGIYNSSSSGTISGNKITAATGFGNTYGIYNMSSFGLTITNNLINGGSSVGSSYGVYDNNSWPTITNNTIFVGGTSGYVIGQQSNSQSIITNNILFTTGSGNRYGFAELDTNSEPASFQNNLIFDCPTALYLDENATPRTTEAQVNTAASTTQGIASSSQGNLGPATVSNFAAVFFASASDLHLTALTPVNVRCGGRNAGLSVCGASGTTDCGSVTADLDNSLRTFLLSGTCTGASNTGAAGYSLGAYETD